VLGNCQTLIRSLAEPRDRLGIIPLHTQTSGVHLPEVELGKRITLISKGTQYLVRHTVVAFADGSSSIIEWARGCARSQAQHEHNGAEDRFRRAHLFRTFVLTPRASATSSDESLQ
jgi:hypothetical protein